MRVDKLLWCLRYYKTRNMATQACRKGAIKINDEVAKPSREVFAGDNLTVRKDQIDLQLEVLDIPPSRVGAKLLLQYRKDTTSEEAYANKEFASLAQKYYRQKGSGRPTKKDRRDLDEFTDLDEE
ncbi:RNA-binding S4 domain-containing protein [Aureitalea marina]|uniref:RNA-binding protein n=1 Tax=Aureitalea marina TaxID=930804 RepID=A0A2S7KMW9_9FLAO|nr:S4 domain-containing protein [Aureitalea marina]PQB03977.1 RNA-binding protein [Aureitalea marina]